MSVIIIMPDHQNIKILKVLAKKLGADVLSINEDLYEDLALGLLTDRTKTGGDLTIVDNIHGKRIIR